MRISYRQGLIAAPAGFLSISSTANYIDLSIGTNAVIAAIANGPNNYLVSEESSVTQAWGPLVAGQTNYLYWDLNSNTGAITRRSTILPVALSASAPSSPVVGQMWWDTANIKMFEWTGTRWNNVNRVFAAEVNGNTIDAEPLTSQVGLNTPASAGYVLTDGFGNTFRSASGAFLTTETNTFQNDTGSLVKLDNAAVIAQANENIPAGSFVYLINGRVALAAGNNNAKSPSAFVSEPVPQNSPCQLHLAGKQAYSESWNFLPAQWGQSVYCDAFGQITLTQPQVEQFIRCGYIINATSIFLTFDTRYSLNPVDSGGGGDSANIVPVAPLQILTVGEDLQLSIPAATNFVSGYMTSSDFARIGTIEAALPNLAPLNTIWAQNQVSGLTASLAGKAALSHTHSQADVINLVSDLAAKANIGHTHSIAEVVGLTDELDDISTALSARINTVPAATAGNIAVFGGAGQLVDGNAALTDFATTETTWPISSVINLQNQLDSLAPLSTIWPTSAVTGLDDALVLLSTKADLVQPVVAGRLAGLDVDGNLTDSGFSPSSFALANATWAISSVTGLQSALDLKANSVHAHIINDVTGLQTALDNKITVGTSIPIAQVTGLQTSLNARVNKAGDTMTGDLTVPQLFSTSISLNADGSISLAGDKGVVGQVLTSAASGQAIWTNLPDGAVVSAPAGQMVVGTGAGIAGESSVTISTEGADQVLDIDGILRVSQATELAGPLFLTDALVLGVDSGTAGQVLASTGAATPEWIDLPSSGIVAPANAIIFGTGTDVTYSASFSFDPVTETLAIGLNTTIDADSVNTTDLTITGTATIATLTVSGAINGVDIETLDADFTAHVGGTAGRHEAADVDITAIAEIPGATTVQEALAYIGANLTSGSGDVIGYEHTQLVAATVWSIVHNQDTLRAQVSIYDETMQVVYPDSIEIIDSNTIEVTFLSAQAGSAIVLLF